jgi:hypothetical protein
VDYRADLLNLREDFKLKWPHLTGREADQELQLKGNTAISEEINNSDHPA